MHFDQDMLQLLLSILLIHSSKKTQIATNIESLDPFTTWTPP